MFSAIHSSTFYHTCCERVRESVMRVLHAIQCNECLEGFSSVMIFPHHIISCFVYLSYMNSCVLHISIPVNCFYQITKVFYILKAMNGRRYSKEKDTRKRLKRTIFNINLDFNMYNNVKHKYMETNILCYEC